MPINFPLYPDDRIFSPDNRVLMNNRQIFTHSPSISDEESLTRNFGPVDLTSTPSKLPQGQRTTYNSVKRPLGSKPEEVNTFERSHRRTAIEESKERAKRAAVQPRRPKGYVYPTDRVRPTLHSKIEEKPRINEERLTEYQRRKQLNSVITSSNKVSFDEPVQPDELVQGDLFSRESTDYFKRKRESLFDRGIQ
ncbi:hypothetical protein [Lactovum miscens]|uniref:Membrane-bound lytic murein transglycosylase n=1 Tax=Lactovum miscens TaxID=190387 RepID=A0A841C7Q0_9LACT|nr:hypothetical protein [Lactovum miscens]MBB5887270.1 membrane-bound lytic murein transglycosylase [Lactovum miscens]